MLNIGDFSAPNMRTQKITYISWPRAALRSPRSTTFFQPKLSFSSWLTRALAPSSLPQTKTSCSPAQRWVDHQRRGQGVERLHHLEIRERALKLLGD